MLALRSHQPGGPDTLTLDEIPAPVPGPGDVVVKMRACGINFPDVLVIEDRYQVKPPRPFAPGGEIAGIVESVGADVHDLKPGDRVMAQPGYGGMAQRVCIKASACTRLPESMTFEHAATLIVTYGTVHYALTRRARLRAGETLLVLGAGGGIGIAAVELGHAAGARVIAAASSEAKIALARQCGAAAGFVYPTGAEAKDSRALARLFKEQCGPQGADVILDPIGDVYAEPALRAIAWAGRYLVVGFAAGAIPAIPLNLPLLKGCDILGVIYGGHVQREPSEARKETDELMDLYTRGSIRPRISMRYPLERGGEAIAEMGARRALGKLVVLNDA
jgi:NADPH2:quinone reductase